MLTLYYKPTCPFCQKVLAVSDELGIEFDLADVTEGQGVIDELIEKGGKQQVPYLVDTDRGEAMYESDAIIAYLKEHYAAAGADVAAKPKIHVSDATCVACEGQGMYVRVAAFPGGKRERVTNTGPHEYEIVVREPAERNVANRRIRELVALSERVELKAIRLIAGHHSSHKVFSINNDQT